MKTLLLIFLMLMNAVSMNAQASRQSADARKLEMRNKLNIDYSMPDFSTSVIDGNIIGTRLAKILEFLANNHNNTTYKNLLSYIMMEQADDKKYVEIESYQIKKIEKTANEITISFQTKLTKNSAKRKNPHFSIRFLEGVSDSKTVNELFSLLGRYIKE